MFYIITINSIADCLVVSQVHQEDEAWVGFVDIDDETEEPSPKRLKKLKATAAAAKKRREDWVFEETEKKKAEGAQRKRDDGNARYAAQKAPKLATV